MVSIQNIWTNKNNYFFLILKHQLFLKKYYFHYFIIDVSIDIHIIRIRTYIFNDSHMYFFLQYLKLIYFKCIFINHDNTVYWIKLTHINKLIYTETFTEYFTNSCSCQNISGCFFFIMQQWSITLNVFRNSLRCLF